MREIKFRAWDKITKRFYLPEKDKVFISLIGSICPVEEEKGEESEWSLCNNRSYRMELNQYTGLKDKNGKDIYEGDIVKDNWFDYNEKYIGDNWIVKFGEYDEGGWDSHTSIGFYFEDKDGEENSILGLVGEMEVLGNIYENPELLNNFKGGENESLE